MDSLKFKDSRRYSERLEEARIETSEEDALIVMQGSIKAIPVVTAAFEFGFLGGSMGSAVGERFVRGVQACLEQHLPHLRYRERWRAHAGRTAVAHADGEDVRGPVQLAGAPAVHLGADRSHDGRVSASFAMIGDVVIAEPGALIGFAGPRVIEQPCETLPEGFQRSEFLLEHGAIDMIVDRREMRDASQRTSPAAQAAPSRCLLRVSVRASPPSSLALA